MNNKSIQRPTKDDLQYFNNIEIVALTPIVPEIDTKSLYKRIDENPRLFLTEAVSGVKWYIGTVAEMELCVTSLEIDLDEALEKMNKGDRFEKRRGEVKAKQIELELVELQNRIAIEINDLTTSNLVLITGSNYIRNRYNNREIIGLLKDPTWSPQKNVV